MTQLPGPIKLLRRFCPDELLEAIEGDLLEKYQDDLTAYSDKRAKRRLWWNVVRLFHPTILLRNTRPGSNTQLALLINYVKVGSRNFRKDPFYSATNVLGLSLAFAFALLALLYIQHETSFDQFHTNRDQIFRLAHKITNRTTGQLKDQSAVTAVPLAKDLADEIPNILHFTRLASNNATIRIKQTPYLEKIHFVDTGFLEMFDFPLLEGTPNALFQPGEIIVSERKARQLFGSQHVVGHSISLTLGDSLLPLQIGGIIDARHEKSSIPFDFLLPIDLYQMVVSEESFDSYKYGLIENYIQLKTETDFEVVNASVPTVMKKFIERDENDIKWLLQPFSTLHFEQEVPGNALYSSYQKIWILIVLLIFVICIAVINYGTMSISATLRRSDEMAVRRTLGAQNHQVWKQMISESMFSIFLAVIIGLVATYLLLPTFHQIIGEVFDFSLSARLIVIALLTVIFIGLLTSSIQSFIFNNRQGKHSLSKQMQLPKLSTRFSNVLVIFQFALCMVMLLGSIYIRLQIEFIQTKDLGFEKDLLVEINLDNDGASVTAKEAVQLFQNLSGQHPEILHVTGSMNNVNEPWTELVFDQMDGSKEKIFFNQIGYSYLETMGIEIKSGKNFDQEQEQNNRAILVNEALVEHFGWDDPIGKQIPGKNFVDAHQIIGVVEDYHFSTLHEKIKPLILALNDRPIRSGITGLSTYVWPPNLYRLYVRLMPGDLNQSVELLRSIWQQIRPAKPFIFQFVDDALTTRYKEEVRWGNIADAATIMAMFIAWLGLIASIRFSIQNRRREIGMRKILGSSTLGIITRLGSRYFKLVLFGCLFGIPIAWILISNWLDSFVYRVEISPLIMFLGFLAVLTLVIFSSAIQTFRIANHPPLEALYD